MYPPEGEKSEGDSTPRSSTDLQSSLMERLRSIEENLTNLNKQEMVQEPPSPYISSSISSSSSAGARIAAEKKLRPVSFVEQVPPIPPPTSTEKEKEPGEPKSGSILRHAMAATRVSIESEKRKITSPLKGARPSPPQSLPI